MSSIPGFLWSESCVSSPQLSRLFGLKSVYVHLETPKVEAVVLPKLVRLSPENNVLVTPASNMNSLFFLRDSCVVST